MIINKTALAFIIISSLSACGGGGEESNSNIIDADSDGIADSVDNCKNTSNANQLDNNNNGIGASCEAKPTVSNIQATTNEDESINITLLGNDSEQDSLTFTVNNQSLSQGTSQYTYTPESNTHGEVTLNYTAHDGDSISDTGTITVTIIPKDDLTTGTITIAGNPFVGETLTLNSTLSDPDGDIVIAENGYQWLADNSPINGANQSSLTLTDALINKLVSTTITYSDGTFDSDTITTTQTSPISVNNAQTNYFQNKVFDDSPEELFPDTVFNSATNDTQRLIAALQSASTEDADGGVVILRASTTGGNNRYRLDRIDMPANTRLEIDPEITIEMIGNLKTSGPTQFLFNIGRSLNVNNLLANRVENVEIRSTDSTRRFTIDSKTNMPISYGVNGDRTKDESRNFTRSIPIGIYYAENFAISDVLIIDNHTESVSVQMYPDTDYRDGAIADRNGTNGNPSDDTFLDAVNGNPLPIDTDGNFVDTNGNIIADVDAILRNETYGRTPRKGTIKNIRSENSHTGYGAVQAYGADWVYIQNIEALNGIGVRLEAGNGAPNDNINRAGPYLSSINNIEVHDVTVTKGFTGVWLKAHSKINTNILVNNVTAIDSATAVLSDKSHLVKTARDFISGRFENLRITGDITLTRTTENAGKALAEVGNVATFFMSPAERNTITDTNNDNNLTQADLPHNLSGVRWYLMQPTSPLIMANRRSATEIGNQSSDVSVDEAGYFDVDYSQANVISNNPLRPELILFNEDTRNLNGGNSNRL